MQTACLALRECCATPQSMQLGSQRNTHTHTQCQVPTTRTAIPYYHTLSKPKDNLPCHLATRSYCQIILSDAPCACSFFTSRCKGYLYRMKKTVKTTTIKVNQLQQKVVTTVSEKTPQHSTAQHSTDLRAPYVCLSVKAIYAACETST